MSKLNTKKVSITTEHGKFVAETIEEATRLATEALEKQEEKTRSEREHIASTENYKNAYNIMTHMGKPADQRPRWIYLHEATHLQELLKDRPGDYQQYGREIKVESSRGTGYLRISKDTSFLAYIQNGAGFTIAVCLKYEMGGSEWYAVSAYEGEVSMHPLPKGTFEKLRTLNTFYFDKDGKPYLRSPKKDK